MQGFRFLLSAHLDVNDVGRGHLRSAMDAGAKVVTGLCQRVCLRLDPHPVLDTRPLGLRPRLLSDSDDDGDASWQVVLDHPGVRGKGDSDALDVDANGEIHSLYLSCLAEERCGARGDWFRATFKRASVSAASIRSASSARARVTVTALGPAFPLFLSGRSLSMLTIWLYLWWIQIALVSQRSLLP